MSRLWLAALGTAVLLACGDDNGVEPNQLFPDVAGTYAVQGQFDGVSPEDMSFTGTLTIQQESLESSILTGTANLTITRPEGPVNVTGAELQNAGVSLAGVVMFDLEQGQVAWEFSGERAGDILQGPHTLTLGAQTLTGTWTGER